MKDGNENVAVRPQVSGKTHPTERRFTGTIRLLGGFVLGALFVLIPVYYYDKGRESALRETLAPSPPPEAAAPGAQPTVSGASPPFASRMTYELSRLPEEPVPVVARSAPAAARATAEAPTPAPAPRVADARPISAVPPDPRDRTAAIESEAHKAEYRQAPRGDAAASRVKVFEGREVDMKTSPVARAEPAAPEPVAGITPITRPAQKPAAQTAPEAPTNGTSGVSAARGESVEKRLAATRDWLAQASQSTHTIQLMGASDEAQLDAQLKTLEKLLDSGPLYVYRTVAQGKPSITVVYGAYADRKSALQALDKLPAELAANRPVLRTVNGIRAEMKQHKTGG